MVEAGGGRLPDEFFNSCGFAGDGRLYVGYNLGVWPVVRPFHPRTGIPYETIHNVSVPGLLSGCTVSKDGALKVLVYHDDEYDYYGNGSYARWGVLYFNLSTWRLLAAYPIHANMIIWREKTYVNHASTLCKGVLCHTAYIEAKHATMSLGASGGLSAHFRVFIYSRDLEVMATLEPHGGFTLITVEAYRLPGWELAFRSEAPRTVFTPEYTMCTLSARGSAAKAVYSSLNQPWR